MRPRLVRFTLIAAAAPVVHAQPVLPDWGASTFASSSATVSNPLFPRPVGLVSVHQGYEGDTFERVKSVATGETKSILGIDTRVVREWSYQDGLLVELAEDWFAQDTDGTVWYFGESVVNYLYDPNGVLIGTNTNGSWIADGVGSFPGVIMFAAPALGHEYFQEHAPGIAQDFARIDDLAASVHINFGSWNDALQTGEGDWLHGPELTENKFYAPGVGLVLIQGLDDLGQVEHEIPLVSQTMVPAPGAIALLALAAPRRRRGGR